MSGGSAAVPAATRALQAALAAEHAAVYGYGVVGAYLTGTSRASATSDWLAHELARDALEAMLRSRGAQPVAAAAGYQLPVAVKTAPEAAQLAVTLEDRVAAAYLGLVAVSVTAIRQFGTQQLQDSALRAAAWRGSTVAFPGLPPSSLAAPRRD